MAYYHNAALCAGCGPVLGICRIVNPVTRSYTALGPGQTQTLDCVWNTPHRVHLQKHRTIANPGDPMCLNFFCCENYARNPVKTPYIRHVTRMAKR